MRNAGAALPTWLRYYHVLMRRKKSVYLFCDEAGFTGNKLLDAEQEVFAYATVAIEPVEASDLTAKIRRDFRLQGKEIKGSSLLRSTQGKKAITELLERCDGHYRVVAHLKPYALAAKFFEYIFEPAMCDFNSFLYRVDFHRFIATILFVYFRAQDKSAELLLDQFTKFAHRGDAAALEMIFSVPGSSDYKDDVLKAISTFALLHKDKITEEVLSFREPGIPNWILDLTTTSLFSLLAWWGERFKELEVICDESKPIKGDIKIFNGMINMQEMLYVEFQDRKGPFTFNLGSPLRLAKSHENPGLQIADVLASTTAYVWRSAYRSELNAEGKEWHAHIAAHMGDGNIWPDFEHANLANPICFANTVMLHGLISRSIEGRDLFAGLPQLFRASYEAHPQFLIRNPNLIKSNRPHRKTKPQKRRYGTL